MAGIPANRVVLRSASLLTDAMERTGNRMPVMDAMGHGMMDMTRLYQHPGTKQIREAIEKKESVGAIRKVTFSHTVLGGCVMGWCK